MTKIDVVSGFLGAGKTTLIKKLLSEALKGQKVVLIENEFGEIGVDSGFLKDAGIEITEMNSGCICCSLVGDFATALNEVVSKYAPERIIIEPSGVGKLSDVMNACVNAHLPGDVILNSQVAVVDASKAKMYIKNFGEFFNNQIENAGTIILSRTGNISEDKLNTAIELIREHNAKATIITTPWDELDGETILKTIENAGELEQELLNEVIREHKEHEHHHHDHDEHCHHDHDHEEEHEHHHEHDENCTCGCHDHEHHHHHHADDVFTSWGKETPHKFERAKIEEILKGFAESDNILRAKGMVENVEGGWIYFDMVPGEYEIREGDPDYTGRIVVIGTEIHEHELEELFGLK